MKKIFQKLLAKLVKKAINKSVNDAVSNPDAPDVDPIVVPGDDSKKNLWKFILQTLISIPTAILTALGATSCMGLHLSFLTCPSAPQGAEGFKTY